MTQQASWPQWPFMESEGLRDLPITHLVVGDPQALVLGRRMAWQSPVCADAVVAAPTAVRRPLLLAVVRWPRSWQVLAAAAMVASVAGTLLANAAPRPSAPIATGLPVHPAALGVAAVRVVAADYLAPEPSREVVRLAPLPSSEPPKPQRVALSARAAGAVPGHGTGFQSLPAAPKGAPLPLAPEQASRPAVVLDEFASEGDRERAPASTAAPAVSGPAPSIVPITQRAALVRPAPGSGRTLIAITPDSKLAVFTDPHTGLPQQFHVGDPLPGGDTVRAIDGSQGTVVTSAREYRLD